MTFVGKTLDVAIGEARTNKLSMIFVHDWKTELVVKDFDVTSKPINAQERIFHSVLMKTDEKRFDVFMTSPEDKGVMV